MDVNKLFFETTNKIKDEINAKVRSKQSIIDSYLPDIEALRSHGVSYKNILILSEIPLELKHFYTLIERAKTKQKAASNNGKRPLIKNSILPTDSSISVSHEVSKQTEEKELIINKHSANDFQLVCFNNAYLIKEVLKTDLSPNDIKSWQCGNQFQLSDRLSDYKRKLKLKRN